MIAYRIKYKDGHSETGTDFETMYSVFLSSEEAEDFESFEEKPENTVDTNQNLV